jgi:zinc transport system substrate-binding protein
MPRWALVVAAAAMVALVPLGMALAAPQQSDRLRVVASFYPMAYFAQQLGGDDVEVIQLVPVGVEPHEWEPTPRDMVTVQTAKVLVLNGAGLEGWADRVVPNLPADGPVVVTATAGLPLLQGAEDDEDAGAWDPHTWLDPYLAQLEVQSILEGLVKADPAREASYRSRARDLYQRLADLYYEELVQLTGCPRTSFVTSHNAFQYLAKRFQLRSLYIAGLSPNEEPSPTRLAELTKLLKRENVRYIYFETLASPALAETLAREVGAQTLPLNPIEGLLPEELAAGADYFTISRQNVRNLRLGLECS